MGLPPGAQQLISEFQSEYFCYKNISISGLLAPHLLQNKSDKDDDKFPIQTIDPAVFKMRNRNRKSGDKIKSNEKLT